MQLPVTDAHAQRLRLSSVACVATRWRRQEERREGEGRKGKKKKKEPVFCKREGFYCVPTLLLFLFCR